jgi:putative ABC transport system permease protein
MNGAGFTLHEVRRKPGRMLLTLLGVTLGLAGVVATRLSIHTVRNAYRDLFSHVAGEPTLQVKAVGQAGFDVSLASLLAAVPGVKTVAPCIHGAAGIVGPAGAVTTPIVGLDPSRSPDGERLTGDEDGLLDDGLARSLGLAVGDWFRLWTPAGLVSMRLAGTISSRAKTAASGGVLIVSLGAARRFLDLKPTEVNCLEIFLGEDVERVHPRIAGRLPAGLMVHRTDLADGLARSTLLATELGLSALCALALAAAGFVIFNTFSLNLGERRQPLALLKTLGATRRQVLRVLLNEALVLGLVGSAGGCLLGAGLAVLLLRTMEQFLGVGLPGVRFTPGPFLLAGLLGPGTTLAAACGPIWRASNRSPLQELLGGRSEGREPLPWRKGILGLVLLLVGVLAAAAPCWGWVAGRVGQELFPPALAVLLAGGVLAFPLLLMAMLRALRVLPLGLLSRLAVQQLEQHPSRTGLTAGVLFLALAAAVGFGQSLRGILHDLHDWYRRTIVADFLIRASMPDTTFTLATSLPDNLAAEVRAVSGVAAVDRLAFLPAEGEGRDVLVLARTFSLDGPLPLDLREGEPGRVRQGLMRGEVVLGTALAEQLGLHVGDHFTLTTAQGPVKLDIAGTAAEFAAGGSSLYLEWQAATRWLDHPKAHVLLVRASPGEVEAVGPLLQSFCRERQLLLQTNSDLREMIDRELGRATGAIWALLALVYLVASLGVVNTLQMNIHEQGRAFALLRALGMKGRQVVRLVLLQPLLLGALTLVPGMLAGVGLAYTISRGSASWSSAPITFRLDPTVLLCAAATALGSAVLAGLPAARRAIREQGCRIL